MRVITVLLLLLAVVAGGEAAGVVRIALEPVVTSGLSDPVLVTHAGDGSGRLFVVEQAGRIRIVGDGTLAPAAFLDISSRVLSGGERGLLGLAFHPRFSRNGRYFVNYTRRPDHFTVIAEYRVSTDPNVSRTRERVVLVVAQPRYTNHKGGMIAFGADGFLYTAIRRTAPRIRRRCSARCSAST
jgi:glucose/arabinose dehydrogenase